MSTFWFIGIFFLLFKWGNFKQRFACCDFDYYNPDTNLLFETVTFSDCITPLSTGSWSLMQKVSVCIDALFVLYRSCRSNVRCCISNCSKRNLRSIIIISVDCCSLFYIAQQSFLSIEAHLLFHAVCHF